jgi:hypothetical protein
LFEDNKITLDDFHKIFGDIRCFCDRIKKLIEST